jgi:TPR repeat protein
MVRHTRGDVAAIMYLASRYEKGRGVEKNPKTAVELFRQAADRGSAQGMCFLGDMYLWGTGVEKSQSDAYRWYVAALAATPAPGSIRPMDFVTLSGDYRKNCERNRKQAEKGLKADERASAEQAALAWLAKLQYTRIP